MSKTAEKYSKEFDSMYGDYTPDLSTLKAEEAALKAYPEYIADMGFTVPQIVDLNKDDREKFKEGYKQAQKNLKLTWKDMRRIICIDEEMMDDSEVHLEWKEEQPYYEEVLRRFEEGKK